MSFIIGYCISKYTKNSERIQINNKKRASRRSGKLVQAALWAPSYNFLYLIFLQFLAKILYRTEDQPRFISSSKRAKLPIISSNVGFTP